MPVCWSASPPSARAEGGRDGWPLSTAAGVDGFDGGMGPVDGDDDDAAAAAEEGVGLLGTGCWCTPWRGEARTLSTRRSEGLLYGA